MITSKVTGCIISNFKNKKYDIIIHGCNCFNTMGAGLAKNIKKEFYSAYEEDIKTKKGCKNKLGNFTYTTTEYGIIINAYTQYHYRGISNCDYNAIKSVFTNINKNYKGKNIGIPTIGSGLAGGDWEKIHDIINENTPDINIEVVYYKQNF